MMFGTTFPSPGFLPPHDDPKLLLGSLADTLRSSDITFGNLEGSFLDRGEPVKKCRDTSICYLFRMPERYASVLDYCGFDLLSLANNHFGDFGWPAAEATRRLLDSFGIKYAGIPDIWYATIEKDSVKYGFCAFSPTAGAPDINNIKQASSIVQSLSARCDIVIVSFHGGAEGANYQNVSRTTELFYGEQRGNVYEFAHAMIDSGADIIFGHGPHVTRAVELYKDRFICYSLGNFCTYGRFNINGPNGIAPVMRVTTDRTGKFVSAKIIPVYQGSEGVRFDPQGRVIKKIRELTAADFPETELIITPEGNIFNKN
jgi:poly-gamma-glutamate capsule biosynthesis protein CapA/YwtB (metallophosphatase superfamily)